MDNLGRDALATAMSVIRKRDLSAHYQLERGQIVLFNNREGLHHRAEFKNGDALHEKRHLVRLWFRNEGRPFFDG
jgi:alpha-ketoglutarate-dependent taurine dioxygenase